MAYNSLSIENEDLTYDISVRNGKLVRAYHSDSVKESVKQRLLTVKEEWFLDLRLGLPWFTELTGRNVLMEKIKSSVARTIIGTDKVSELVSLDIDFDKTVRRLFIQFEYIDEFKNRIKGEL